MTHLFTIRSRWTVASLPLFAIATAFLWGVL